MFLCFDHLYLYCLSGAVRNRVDSRSTATPKAQTPKTPATKRNPSMSPAVNPKSPLPVAPDTVHFGVQLFIDDQTIGFEQQIRLVLTGRTRAGG
jgi:hypothetical protein